MILRMVVRALARLAHDQVWRVAATDRSALRNARCRRRRRAGARRAREAKRVGERGVGERGVGERRTTGKYQRELIAARATKHASVRRS